jgi:hypothetical protein
MDDKTTATRPAAPTGGPARRRALAAAALLLSVTAAVTACGSSGGHKTAATGVAASASVSAAASPSDSASGSAAAGSSAAPGDGATAAPGGSGTVPAGRPSAPIKSPSAGDTPLPVDPIHPPAAFKPQSYLVSGTQITVFFTAGICDKYGLKLNEASDKVGVDVVITQNAPVGRMCPNLSKVQSVAGTLSQPLNGRPVVSLRDGSPVPLESAPNGGPVSAGN